ncbi:MAG: Bax inhibitor-1/YccA family protein [Saprospiraceae bacterium]|uniref:Bax inhibitor-1/YccA family protein n=1 Tax=Candidatus Defluviibacterium haderslevense TaxID=2981993 RepID=A0A9D7SAW5_9BACT|nr:Bax inhibitor-1/YccA family protein [Candidatus Defluviibacterium haderslevense]
MALKLFNSSSNPILKDSLLEHVQGVSGVTMTSSGAVNKSIILGLILLATAIVSWMFPSTMFLWPAAIIGFVLVLIASFKKEWSGIIAPIYAAIEGLFVGTISLVYASAFNGIVFQATTLTIAILFLMLFLYKSGLIKVTNKLRSVIMIGTGAIALTYLVSMILSFFSIQIPMIHSTGMLGIGFSLVVIVIASLNLLLDFDFFEKGEQAGLPSYMEWFAAMGLIITLVWLYLELLRLLSKFGSKD